MSYSVRRFFCLRFASACENFGAPLLKFFESPLKVTCQKLQHSLNKNQIRNPILGTSLYAILVYQKDFKMACRPIFGFFRYNFFQWFSLGPLGQVKYYGTSRRCLAAILADLQANIGIRPRKHEISIKMDFDGLGGCKIMKKSLKMGRNTRIKSPKLPELRSLKKSHWVAPRVSLYLQKPLWDPQGYKSGGEPLDFGFLAKNH